MTGVVSTQKYWPYGATRSGAITQTDKLYTGQQREETGARQDATNALGLYNYKARFYSTVTGRFVSADPVAKDGLNRYSYVRDNPLRFVDPSGLDAGLLCGTGQDCQWGQNLEDYRPWVENYWRQHEHIFGGMEYDAYSMLEYVIQHDHWSWSQTFAAFHVGFMNTIPSKKNFSWRATKDGSFWYGDTLETYEKQFYDHMRPDSVRGIDTLIGFSAGGSVVERILAHPKNGYSPQVAILIEPADFGFRTSGKASDYPNTTIVEVNETSSWIGGMMEGANTITTSGDCFADSANHCPQGDTAWLAMEVAYSGASNVHVNWDLNAVGNGHY